MHLKLDLWGLTDPYKHAQEYMRELGITYQEATPQSVLDCWWFWNCENVPDSLPRYLSELKITPHEAIGHGLSKEDADKIVACSNVALSGSPLAADPLEGTVMRKE